MAFFVTVENQWADYLLHMTPTYLNLLLAVQAYGLMYPLPTAVPSCDVGYRVARPLPPALANSQIPARADRVPILAALACWFPLRLALRRGVRPSL
jgi:hypothetical protein